MTCGGGSTNEKTTIYDGASEEQTNYRRKMRSAEGWKPHGSERQIGPAWQENGHKMYTQHLQLPLRKRPGGRSRAATIF